ncbi:hypothetical protein I302_107877 [Kwoniella bestiolae CBS 10118]|uniref:Uncharacterized protein n=1 Tax=Kwoniella bestiolae CBS 10118 TaxID=1296100 RepID=A0A1B9FXB2_9TREE|nr:hypothetical protein I302_06381 [Kwoniella bestiolae CBS 10118]OCF23400.1 hypothetical protein I302_06381 [Kwoniella bestiolae CBS 10118]
MSIEYFEYLDPSAYQVSQPGSNESSTPLGGRGPGASERSNADTHDRSRSGRSTSFLARAKDTTLSFFKSCIAKRRGKPTDTATCLATRTDDPPTYQEATRGPTPWYVENPTSNLGIPRALRLDWPPFLGFPSIYNRPDPRSMGDDSARVLRLLLQGTSWNTSHISLPGRAERLEIFNDDDPE